MLESIRNFFRKPAKPCTCTDPNAVHQSPDGAIGGVKTFLDGVNFGPGRHGSIKVVDDFVSVQVQVEIPVGGSIVYTYGGKPVVVIDQYGMRPAN